TRRGARRRGLEVEGVVQDRGQGLAPVARDDAPQKRRHRGEVGDETGRDDVLDRLPRPRGTGAVVPVGRAVGVAELLEDLELDRESPPLGQLTQVHRDARAPPPLGLPHERHAGPRPLVPRGYGPPLTSRGMSRAHLAWWPWPTVSWVRRVPTSSSTRTTQLTGSSGARTPSPRRD